MPGAGEVILKGAFARLDGTAATSFQPCLRVKTPNGAIMFECVGTTVAGGGTADVTWFHGLVASAASSSGTTTTRNVVVPMILPDFHGNAYPALSSNLGLSNPRDLVPTFQTGQDGTWDGRTRIPADYVSGGTLTLTMVVNATSGAVRVRVGTAVVAAGVSENTAYTQESYVNQSVPASALQRFDTAFTLSSTLAALSDLNVQVTRNGTSGSDTCGSDVMLWQAVLSYTGK